ncbi:helix-turn-helix domain-containing protein [Pseudomonas resinovorans]|uniref:Helix-turn-helix domain-containing protein n=1 Tax=Metapseudomonas resinovorans TaxID=53412 RepID=A0ABT4YB85_METRE|nr:helix-turn-helix domain-containing protein [Pseudomonas resinovorans]MDA8485867.1 helix-turn-helix domain-containing protein [Pseudomonas resinovorans]
MNLAEILDRPIAFQRVFVSLGVGITGALMLSQALYWSKRSDDAEGWFYKTMEDWESETGMTRSEQEGARRKLVSAGVLEEMKKGVPCRLYFRVKLDELAASLGAENPKTRVRKSRKPVCRKPANKAAGNQQASLQQSSEQARGKPAFLTEITTETTAEITTESLPAEQAAPASSGQVALDSEPSRPRCEIPVDMPGPKDQTCKTFRAWANYAMAYRKRYNGQWPVWNAKVGGLLGKLVDRLGQADAPKVAAFFVGINDARLINACHPVTELLRNAEGYRTQWANGRQMNATTARQIEQTQANLNAAQQAAQNIRERGEGRKNAFL